MIRTLGARKTQGAAATKVRPDGLWRHPDFLKFWAGETVSLFGTQITLLALPLTAVLLLNATPSQMGLLTAIEFVPFLFITLFAGVWTDRKRRRPVLVASNLGRGILLATVPAAALMGWLTIEYLFLVVFLFGILGVFFEVAYQSFLPSLVEREELVEGNSKLFASASAAEIGGPGLAGLLVGTITAPFALVLDAASFIVAGGSLWLIRKPEPEPMRQGGKRHVLREIKHGIQATFSDRYLRLFAGEAATYNFFNQVFVTLLVLYATRELRLGPEMLGLVFAVGSIGSLLGSVLAARTARRFGLGKTITFSAAVSCFAPLLIPLAGVLPGMSVPILMASYFATGLGVSLCNVHVFSARQALMPDQMRGRMTASYRFVTWGAIPLGALLSGLLAEALGLWPTLMLGAMGLTTPWLWFLFSPVLKLREMPRPDGVPDATGAEQKLAA